MIDPVSNAYPIFYNNQKLTTFYYPKEKVIDPNFDIKENFKLFHNKNNGLIRIQLGGQTNKSQWTETHFVGETYNVCSDRCGNKFFKETIYMREKF